MPAVEFELNERRWVRCDRPPDRVGGRVAGGRLDGAVCPKQQHGGVDETGQPRQNGALRVLLAERIHQVQLHRREALQGAQVAADQRAIDRTDHLSERGRQRDREDRKRPGLRLGEQDRRYAPEHQLDAEAERRRSGRLQLGDQQALALGVVPEPHAGGQHDPVGLQPGRGPLDLDRVRAGHAPGERLVAPGQQLEPQLLLGEQVTQRERGLRSRHRPRMRV
jgi:hypothetical protein